MVRDNCMTDNEYERLFMRFIWTLNRLEIYDIRGDYYRLSRDFVKKYRRYTELTDGIA